MIRNRSGWLHPRFSNPIYYGAAAILMGLTLMLTAVAGCGSPKGERSESVPALGVTSEMQPPPPPPPPKTSEQTAVDAILAAYSFDNEYLHLSTLASDKYQGRRSGSAGARAAAAYITDQFTSLGLQPWSAAGLSSFTQHFTAKGIETDNIIGVLPGSQPDGTFIILGAHYDHLGLDADGNAFNGADDNAAGVAATLEAARIFRGLSVHPKKTVVFCAFSGEEEGELGARALGELLNETGLSASVEMINIDGIGATGGNYSGVWDEGSAAAAPLVQSLTEAGNYLGAPVQNDGTDIGSDAQPFDWQFGIPAVTVDWSWGQVTRLNRLCYHTIYDDVNKIDKNILAKASKVAIIGTLLRTS